MNKTTDISFSEFTGSTIKFVKSLAVKKHRDELHCFVAEGTKCVLDTVHAFHCHMIIATDAWLAENDLSKINCDKIFHASSQQMNRMSQFSTASGVIAVYEIPDYPLDESSVKGNLNLVLDGIQDPGNLGTIIRLADWFGIRHIFCSRDTADVFSHKVVQATMGAISRVHVHYCDLSEFLSRKWNMPVYGTFLNGSDIYSANLSSSGFIVMGNEGKGISPEIAALVTDKLTIPPYPHNAITSESLNVGIATAITISEFRRRVL
ncbi:MAG: RNA methyltransferase [Muribaculaceae bacterium]|jgi:TrmH family RNA methyltransferase|nr:RNA methyltransferase [Muribaculaceae bacterium]